MHDPAQIARLAEGLTKAQREAVRTNSFDRSRIGALWRSKLSHLVRRSGYTPLGLAVRQHLTTAAQEKKDVD